MSDRDRLDRLIGIAGMLNCSRVHFLTVVERSGDLVRNAELNFRKGLAVAVTVTARIVEQKTARNRNRRSSLAGGQEIPC